jgi:hypothetical protein
MESRKTNKLTYSVLLIFFLSIPVDLYSQDTILFTSNKIIVCRVKEVSNKAILYTNLSDSSRLKKIKTSSVSKILYLNGTRDVFNHLLLVKVEMDNSKSMYQLGKKYGLLNSHFDHIAVSTFLIASAGVVLLAADEDYDEAILAAPVGILTIAAIPPKPYSMITETFPYNDPEFRRGFDKQRRKEKRKAALKGFAFGVLADAIFILIGSRN